MKKQFVVVTVGVVMLVVMALQWWRAQELQRTVDVLQKKLQAKSETISARQADSKQETDKQRVFKLIDSPQRSDNTTEVGVPWDVERAMMGGARENRAGQLRDGPATIEVSPTIPPSNEPWRMELNLDDAPQGEPDSN
jgi:hypothetical protein